MIYTAVVIALLTGVLIGVSFKGITINIIHKQPVDKPQEYNQSLAHMLPPEIQNYYNNTKGQNLF